VDPTTARKKQMTNSPTPSATTNDPGRVLGIVGFILAFLIPLVGLILSIVAFTQSRKVGIRNTLAFAGIIIAAVFMVIGIIFYATVIPSLMQQAQLQQ
jgi:hypothetical protein